MKQYTYFGQQFDNVLISGYENGVKFNKRVKYEPFLFERGEGIFRTVDDKSLKKVDFSSISYARRYINEKTESQEPIFGLTNFPYVYTWENYNNDVLHSNPDEFKVLNFDIETDSEDGYGDNQKADREIISITFKLFKDPNIYCVGFKPYETQFPELVDLVEKGTLKIHYLRVDNEAELLQTVVSVFKRLQPDILTGYNIEMFDIPYIIKRIHRVLGAEYAKRLSPFGLINHREVEIFNKKQDVYEIVGIPTVDYLQAIKKFTFKNFESYKLDYICGEMLGTGKLDYSEYKTLARLYKENPNKFYDYNVIDVYRVEQLDEYNKFISQIIGLAHTAKVNLADTFTTVRIWDILIHNYLLDQGICVPAGTKATKMRSISGGFVKQPQLGRHKMLMSFDLTSLYPHLIMMYNISPETYMGDLNEITRHGDASVDKILEGDMASRTQELIDGEYTVSGKGTKYSRKKTGFLPSIMKMLFNQRKAFKKKMLESEQKLQTAKAENAPQSVVDAIKAEISQFNNKQMAMKILLNGGYGALSNEHNRWYSDELAESITLSGQLSVRWIANYLNAFMNKLLSTVDVDYIVAIDTDSNYLNVQPIVDRVYGADADNIDEQELLKMLENFAKKVEKTIEEGYEKLYDLLNVHDRCMHMKLEAIGSAVWVAKKRYVMSMLSFEGVHYNPPKIKMQGIDAVRSSTPYVCRSKIKNAIPMIIAGKQEELKTMIDEFRQEWKQLPFEAVAFPRGVNNLEKYQNGAAIYGDRTPINARAALLYNHLVITKGLDKTLPLIRSGDKIRYSRLKLPNPLNENVIAAPDELPEELGISKYIDYNSQFEKAFLDPISSIIEAAGIDISDNVDISQFFTE